MQPKITIRYNLTMKRMAKNQECDNTECCQGYRATDFSQFLAGSETVKITLENNWPYLIDLEDRHNMTHPISCLGTSPTQMLAHVH